MNMNFAKNTYLASIDYVTSLFAATGRDGALRMPKNFGTDEEQDNEFDIFKMSWSRDDLNMLLSEFSLLNNYTQLHVALANENESWSWTPRLGTRPLI